MGQLCGVVEDSLSRGSPGDSRWRSPSRYVTENYDIASETSSDRSWWRQDSWSWNSWDNSSRDGSNENWVYVTHRDRGHQWQDDATKSTMDFQAVKLLLTVMSCHGVSCPLAKQCRFMTRPTRMRKGGAVARSPARIHRSSKPSKARTTEIGNVL